jgi:signal transduction histidine kinase/CheY-like chemotaxis protein
VVAPDEEFDAHVHRWLGVLAAFMGTFFVFFVALGLIDHSAGPVAWPWIVGTDAATCVFYLAAYVAVRGGWITVRWASAVCVSFAVMPAANALLAFALTGDAFFLSYLPILAIGCGAYMLSLPALWVAFGMIAVPAAALAATVLSPVEAAQLSPVLIGSFFVSSFVLVVRRFHVIDSQRALRALQREAEVRKRAEEQLAHIQRLESVGRLASGVAHDFNNLLMVILGYTQSMIETCEDEETVADLEIVQSAGESAATLAAKLLAFGRQQVMQPVVVQANDLVRSARSLLRKSLPADVELALELDDEAGAIQVDPIQIEQVLINLALNARDAMAEGGGQLTLATRRVPSGAHGAVELCVRDTGVGMTLEVQERVFEPFYTTKEVGRGTGLGLAMVHGIVVQSGGSIHIDSTPGRGTTVTVRLPQVETAAPPLSAVPSQPGLELAGLTVLVVDDEVRVRETVVRLLQERGCDVIEAADAVEAVDLAELERFDLMVLDVVMPGMSGVDLLSALRSRGHGQPALLMSGHAAEKVAEAGGLNAPLVQKPFTVDDLEQALARALRQSA